MTRRQFNNMPARIARLPVDPRGYPVPKFVAHIEGKPDFRIMDANHLRNSIKQGLCWICGDRLGTRKAFTVGPMCCINRISPEPPSHRECAVFAAQNCPFLTTPEARRRKSGLPEERTVAGIMIERNPGVTAIWVTRGFNLMQVSNGVLFVMGDPETLEFYARGRIATRAEIDESIRTGFPLLENAARRDGREAIAALMGQRQRFDKLLDTMVEAAA
jgi:hypothetical protein